MLWHHYKRICKDNGAIVLNAAQPFSTKLINSNIKWFKYQWIWQKPQGTDPFMAKKRPLNNIEDILVFMNKQAIYNPQKTDGKPYHTVRDKTPRLHELTGQTMRQTETVNTGWRLPTRILPFNQDRGAHPTQKPVALLEYLIKTYTNEGDTVLDNCMGSGTTGVACQNLNRDFIGIELDDKYFQIAKDRIEAAQVETTD